LEIASILFFFLAIYFSSLTPKPPCQSKVSKWIQGAKEKIKASLPSPPPEPASAIASLN